MTIWRNLANALVVPEIRNRVLFIFGAFAVFVLMVYVQMPYVDIQPMAEDSGQRPVSQFPRLLVRRRAAALLRDRHGHHALHQREHHHATDDRRFPEDQRDSCSMAVRKAARTSGCGRAG